jgi:hypothetical protein
MSSFLNKDFRFDNDIVKDDICVVGVSFSFSLWSTNTTKKLLSRIKEALPNVPLLLGGAYLTQNTEPFFDTCADYLVVGYVDLSLPKLFEQIVSKNKNITVPNVYRKINDKWELTRIGQSTDIRDTPTARFDLIDGNWPKMGSYETLRGCPNRCNFCSYPQLSPKISMRSATRMIEDFKYYADKGVEYIWCLDTSMFLSLKRAKEFISLKIEQNLPVPWGSYAHVNELQSKKLCMDAYKAGCREIYLGVESGNDEVLNSLGKRSSVKKARHAISNLADANIAVSSGFIIGFPGETPATIKDTLNFIKSSPGLFFVEINYFFISDSNVPVVKNQDHFGLTTTLVPEYQMFTWSHKTMDASLAKQYTIECLYDIVFSDVNTLSAHVHGGNGYHYYSAVSTDGLKQIVPIIREYERALLCHPDFALLGKKRFRKDFTSYPESSKSNFIKYRDLARKILDKKMKDGDIEL